MRLIGSMDIHNHHWQIHVEIFTNPFWVVRKNIAARILQTLTDDAQSLAVVVKRTKSVESACGGVQNIVPATNMHANGIL